MIVTAGGAIQGGALVGLSLVSIGAFVGGFLRRPCWSIVWRPQGLGTSVTTMLLAGIAIGALAGALNSLLSYFSDNDMLRQISLWQMGNLSGASWLKVSIMGVVAVPIDEFISS